MKIITSALALLTVLSVSRLAQTSSTSEPVLQIKPFSWGESVWPSWCEGCTEPQILGLTDGATARAPVNSYLLVFDKQITKWGFQKRRKIRTFSTTP